MSDNRYESFKMNKPWLSKSSILTYKYCPYKFYLKNLEKIKTPPSDAMTKGIKFHSWASSIYDELNIDEIKSGEKSLRAEILKTIPEDFTLIDEEEIHLYENFIDMEVERWERLNDKDNFCPITTEEYLEDEDLLYRGYVDRLDKCEDEDAQIIMELKTGNFKEYNMSNYRFELYGYKHLLEKKYDDYNVKYMGIIFPKDKKVVVEEFKSITGTYFYKRVKKTRKRILNREFEKKGYCDYCDYFTEHCNGG